MICSTLHLAPEPMREVIIDLETALPDRRAQRRLKIAGSRAEILHRADTLARDVRDDSAPSGMDRADDVAARVGHQNRHAVRTRDRKQNPTLGSDHAVSVRFLVHVLARHNADRFAMHLMTSRDRNVANHLAEPPPVLIDMRGIVADPIREVETRI